MSLKQIGEGAGVFIIAIALHVSAAALFLSERSAAPGPANASPVPFSAGSQQHSEMIERWETSPEVEQASELEQPEELPEPEIVQPEVQQEPLPEQLAAPAAPLPPDSSIVRPNLPENPELQPVEPELPELQSFAPPVIESVLRLSESERPETRPSRPKPEPVTRKAEPKRQQQALQKQSQPAARQQARPAKSSPSGGGQATQQASPRISKSQLTSLGSQWAAELNNCIARGARNADTRGRGTLTLNITIAGNGIIQGVGLAASSGNADVDRAAIRAIQRVRRCPAAHPALNITTITRPATVRVGR